MDCFGILTDEQIRRHFALGCEVKALGRGHVQRIKEAVREAREARHREVGLPAVILPVSGKDAFRMLGR